MTAEQITNTAAMTLLEKIQEKIEALDLLLSDDSDQRVSAWIHMKWNMELALLKENEERVKDMIRKQEFNF